MQFCAPSIFNDSQERITKSVPATILGDLSEGVPPVPIPNTEVKPLSPDCTARASVWESRKLPGISQRPSRKAGAFVFSGGGGNHAYGRNV